MSVTGDPPPSSSGAPVNERVAAVVNDVIREAALAGADEFGERLRAEAGRWKSSEVTIVVAGEPNRGKSTLVNAMLGREILPSGAAQVTTTFAVIRHGQPERGIVHRIGTDPEEVALADLGMWLTAGASAAVEGVSIEIDHPLLSDGLVLVDSPGVGGLDAAHGRVTLTVLGRADALVFMLDPAEPLSRTELSFLERATERIDRVLFVLSKVDRATGWKTVLGDDKALLAEHAPQFAHAPMLPVSARLKLLADGSAASGTPDASMVNESGVPTLGREILRSVVGRVVAVRLANLLRLASSVLDGLETPQRAAVAASQGESSARAEADRAQAELEQLRDTAERLAVDVNDRFNGIRETANADFSRLLRDLTARFGGDSAEIEESSLVDDLHAELWAGCAELGEELAAEVQRVAADVAVALDDIEIDLPAVSLESSGTTDALVDAEPSEAQRGDPMMRMRIASSVSSGGMALAMFGTRMGGEVILAGVMGAAAVMGLATAAINVRVMRRQSEVAAVRKKVQDALEAARGEVSPAVRQQTLGAQRELERAMRAAVRIRTKQLQDVVASSMQLARAEEAERSQRRAEAERLLVTIGDHRGRVDTLLTEVRALIAPPPVNP